MMMRKATDTSGKCCTVQRTLRDDSVVVRVDGVMGESTVDPTPLTVVRTTNPRHDPGVKLIYLHDKACVDATVEQWPERTIDVKEGSRHRLRVQSQTTNGWVTWRLKDGTEQLQPPKEAEGGSSGYLTIMVGSVHQTVMRVRVQRCKSSRPNPLKSRVQSTRRGVRRLECWRHVRS